MNGSLFGRKYGRGQLYFKQKNIWTYVGGLGIFLLNGGFHPTVLYAKEFGTAEESHIQEEMDTLDFNSRMQRIL